jgi:hypothetical protein
LGVAKQSETLEDLVVYKALYGEGQIWVRPLAMFNGQVEVADKKFRDLILWIKKSAKKPVDWHFCGVSH